MDSAFEWLNQTDYDARKSLFDKLVQTSYGQRYAPSGERIGFGNRLQEVFNKRDSG